MRNFHLLSAFSLLAIFLTFTSAASVAEEPIKKDFEGPSDAQIKKLSFTKLDAPFPIGDMKKEPKDIGWRYLSKAQSHKDIPYPDIPKEKGKCKIKVKADLVRSERDSRLMMVRSLIELNIAFLCRVDAQEVLSRAKL
jgi:hypothetical protein